jgi:hypothetical protein
MICFAKPSLTDDLYIVHKEEFLITCYMNDMHTWQKRNVFIRDKDMLSSERMLRKDCNHKGSVGEKISGREPQGSSRQDELFGGRPPVVK